MSGVSIIVTGRNDNYDGNFEERLSIALSKNLRSLPKAEFIFVEWNPIPCKQLVCKNLQKIFKDKIKYYVVHPKYHRQYCLIDGFLEYPPKNVGIRRASGEFILCTNSDVIFSPEVVMGMESLKNGVLYRASRLDIDQNYLNVQFPVDERYHLKLNKGLMNGAGDFLLAHKDIWQSVTGYCEAFPEQRLHKDAYIIHKMMEHYKYPVVDLGIITHWRHKSSWSNNIGTRPRVGDIYWDFKLCEFTKNPDTWGLTYAKEVTKGGITWLV